MDTFSASACLAVFVSSGFLLYLGLFFYLARPQFPSHQCPRWELWAHLETHEMEIQNLHSHFTSPNSLVRSRMQQKAEAAFVSTRKQLFGVQIPASSKGKNTFAGMPKFSVVSLQRSKGKQCLL